MNRIAIATLALLCIAGTGAGFARSTMPPSALQQYEADGTTVIPVGNTTTSSTLVFSATMTPGGTCTAAWLEVEIKDVGVAFTNTFVNSGIFTAIGGTSTVTISALTNASKHWQARSYGN